MSEQKLSGITRARGVQFIHSLRDDLENPDQLTGFLDAIKEHIGKDVSSQFPWDSLASKKADSDEETWSQHWFGPFSFRYTAWILRAWSKILENHDATGYALNDDKKSLERYATQRNSDIDDTAIVQMHESAAQNLWTFRWKGDPATNQSITDQLDKLYDSLSKAADEDK